MLENKTELEVQTWHTFELAAEKSAHLIEDQIAQIEKLLIENKELTLSLEQRIDENKAMS